MQLHKLPLTGLWTTKDKENTPSTFALYEDVNGQITGYTDSIHLCTIVGSVRRYEDVREFMNTTKISRSKDLKVERLQTMVELTQLWTENSKNGESVTVSKGVVDDENGEIVLEYFCTKEGIVTHRGWNRLRRVNRVKFLIGWFGNIGSLKH